MKRIILFASILVGFATTACAQWSNTSNQFYDSLDMPVSQAPNEQKNALVIKSMPDGGYFIIWEDFRNNPNLADIYAQKINKDGVSQWAINGVPVATGPDDDQRYTNSANGAGNGTDYHNVSHAASDGAGGFYIAFNDYVSIGSYSYSRVNVQHVRSDGSLVFGNQGFVTGNPNAATNIECSSAQLIADGKGGFFIGYARGAIGQSQSGMNVMVYCYKDEGGTLKQYGGAQMNEWATEHFTDAACGTKISLEYSGAGTTSIFATGFVIFPDLQNGCAVAITQQFNTQQLIVGFNRLCRVKKDCHTIVYRRSNDVASLTKYEQDYKKDSVVRLYSLSTFSYSVSCSVSPPIPPTLVEYTNNRVENYGEGLDPLTQFASPLYEARSINGAVLPTDGNIDVCLITWNQRDYNSTTSTVSPFYTKGINFFIEKYDSLPYQLCSAPPAYAAYNTTPPAGLNVLASNGFIDTLIYGKGNYFYDYSFATSGNKALLATEPLQQLTGNLKPVYYQELTVIHSAADTFRLKINTSSGLGVVIGQEKLGGNEVDFGTPPYIAGDGKGNAVLYIGRYHDFIQASPIGEGGSLSWGAMGTPLNAAIWKNQYTAPDEPFIYMDDDGKAVVVWQDHRQTTADISGGNNIYMRHLDNLTDPGYTPPVKTVGLPFPTNSTSATSAPQYLNGSSHAWTYLQTRAFNSIGESVGYTPVVAIKDDYDLGVVTVNTYDNISNIRNTPDGKPYLGRNYTINVTNHPTGASIHVRLLFTKAQFDALKAADNSINNPGDLSIIKQTNTVGTVPTSYMPVNGEQKLQLDGWGTVDNSGYYIEITIGDFSNFFILKSDAALPVTLSSFTAKAVAKTALLEWETATEINNSHFNIQRSADGIRFSTIGRVDGQGTTTNRQFYSFTDVAPFSGNNYYRLSQVDLDGEIMLSAIRFLNFNQLAGSMVVAPNPAIATLYIKLSQAATGQDMLQLYDVNGRQVLQQTVAPGTANLQINIGTLLPGTYILKYGKERLKIVKATP